MKTKPLLILAFAFLVCQYGFVLFYSIAAVYFASHPPEASPPTSMLYGMVAGALMMSGIVTTKLLVVLSWQDGRIQKLERMADTAPSPREMPPVGR